MTATATIWDTKNGGGVLPPFFSFFPSSSVMCPGELPHVSRPLQQQQGLYRRGFVIFSKVMMDGKWTEKPDKATLHQSAIELRGSTVVSASRCLLVEVCPKPPNPYARIDGSFTSLHLCFPPLVSVCLESDTIFFFLSLLCTACFRVVFVRRQVLFSSVRFFL